MSKESYVYLYLDPTKKSLRQTNILSLLYEPFYVGKGTGNRWDFSRRMNDENYFLRKKLKELKKQGFDPYVLILQCDTENDAFALEFQLTIFLGIYPTNSMCNLRHGGMRGFTISQYTKSLLSQLNTGESNPNFGIKWSDGRRKKHQLAWDNKRKAGLSKKTPEEMKHVWEATRRKYLVISPSGERYETDDLTNFSKAYNLPLSALRQALVSLNNTVVSEKSL